MKKIALYAFFILLAAGSAWAETGSTAAANLVPLGAGLAIGLVGLGGALSQGRAVSTALEAIGRNPSAKAGVFTPLILGLVFVESLVILAFVISFKFSGAFSKILGIE